jgi:4-hydroxyphenylpyruvate dioxygenase
MNTSDIIHAVTSLKARGVLFLTIPDAYYENLRKGIASSGLNVTEDIDTIQKL